AGVAELRRYAGATVGVRAGVDPAVDLLGHERAVVLGADPDADGRRVTVERDELLGAVEDDLHRPLRLTRQRRDDRLGAHERLGPERSAHRRRDDAHAVVLETEQAREIRARVERSLRAGPYGEPSVLPL